MSYVIVEHPEIIENFKKHFYLRSIAEAFSKIISKYGDEPTGNKYNDERLSILDQLFDMLSED